jgi:hypothetical protein
VPGNPEKSLAFMDGGKRFERILSRVLINLNMQMLSSTKPSSNCEPTKTQTKTETAPYKPVSLVRICALTGHIPLH